VVFVDESGFMLQPLVRRTWAEKGRTPVIEQWDRRDRVSVIAALVLSLKRRRLRMFFRLLDHNAKAEDFLWFLNDLRKEVQRRLVVVWDNLGAHRRTENALTTLGCGWARFERLPPYAPELNPVEHIWTTVKWGRLANAPPDGIEQLRGNVTNELHSQSLEQRILRSHFRWARLDLN
jgi:transposase